MKIRTLAMLSAPRLDLWLGKTHMGVLYAKLAPSDNPKLDLTYSILSPVCYNLQGGRTGCSMLL